jgi:phage-related protein
MNSVLAQYWKKLTNIDDIWEARIQFGGNIFRILGFENKGRFIVLTNGFAKKTQKTPKQEIKLAEQRKKIYLKEETK